jgi:hypothetical protein
MDWIAMFVVISTSKGMSHSALLADADIISIGWNQSLSGPKSAQCHSLR